MSLLVDVVSVPAAVGVGVITWIVNVGSTFYRYYTPSNCILLTVPVLTTFNAGF